MILTFALSSLDRKPKQAVDLVARIRDFETTCHIEEMKEGKHTVLIRRRAALAGIAVLFLAFVYGTQAPHCMCSVKFLSRIGFPEVWLS
jgi:hypothetical protein